MSASAMQGGHNQKKKQEQKHYAEEPQNNHNCNARLSPFYFMNNSVKVKRFLLQDNVQCSICYGTT